MGCPTVRSKPLARVHEPCEQKLQSLIAPHHGALPCPSRAQVQGAQSNAPDVCSFPIVLVAVQNLRRLHMPHGQRRALCVALTAPKAQPPGGNHESHLCIESLEQYKTLIEVMHVLMQRRPTQNQQYRCVACTAPWTHGPHFDTHAHAHEPESDGGHRNPWAGYSPRRLVCMLCSPPAMQSRGQPVLPARPPSTPEQQITGPTGRTHQ